MPHHAAGMRTEPPISLPSASGTHPEATAAALPPDDPPGVRSRRCGLRVTPQRGLSVRSVWANSGVVVWPMMIAPRPQRSDDVGIVIGDVVGEGVRSERRQVPGGGRRVLDRNGDTVQHTQGPSGGDVLSARSASAIASSTQIDVKQLRLGCTINACSTAVATTSTGDRSPLAIAEASAPAVGAALSTSSTCESAPGSLIPSKVQSLARTGV